MTPHKFKKKVSPSYYVLENAKVKKAGKEGSNLQKTTPPHHKKQDMNETPSMRELTVEDQNIN